MSHLVAIPPSLSRRMKKSTEPLISIRGLAKTYGTEELPVHALRSVDADIHPGEFVAIMGASGSGKSTLLSLLAFLDTPTAGTYQFAGQDITDFDDSYLATLRNATIGFVFQQFHLLPRTSALENVRLPLMYGGVKKAQQITRATAALKKVGLENRMDHTPNELSGGQQQRVSIARALVNNPAIVFCDEPTGNLDSPTARDIMEILSRLHKEGKTIIMVTHEDDIAAYAERIIHMKDGKII